MSLNWQWKEKKGWVEDERIKEYPEWKQWIYHGNAFMIMLQENEKENTWQMASFFVDREHGIRCLENNIFTPDTVFHLYRDKKNVKLAQLLTKYMVSVVWEDLPDENTNN